MTTDSLFIGSAPFDEPCCQLGDPDYQEKAPEECARFIDFIRAHLGQEPPGASLVVKACSHDFGTYYSVACYYDEDDEEALDFALRCESELPGNWD